MRVRELIKQLLECDLESIVIAYANGEASDINRVITSRLGDVSDPNRHYIRTHWPDTGMNFFSEDAIVIIG